MPQPKTTHQPDFQLETYLTQGVENIVKGALKATLKNPKTSAFLLRFAASSQEAARKRAALLKEGEHIPPFLIASITNRCNLHCTGCYARANHLCSDGKAAPPLADEKWQKIFEEARQLGISFILLAGGEPLLRRPVLERAGAFPEILFPVFTNGTLMDETCLRLFAAYPNLFPVFSLEGHEKKTDARRGAGVYEKLITAMEQLNEKSLLFGASVTVTTENLQEVTSQAFLDDLQQRGCKVVFFVEFVPAAPESAALAPQEQERAFLSERLEVLRRKIPDMLLISFPGDEKRSGGCLAAGRGFFHINAHGAAEPCPFSPYSDSNAADTSLRQALQSRLFRNLQAEGLLLGEHSGGCVLFEQQNAVRRILLTPRP